MIILAGGLGTRLRSMVSNVPKPMAPINGRPFLAYLIDHWIEQGIKQFVLSIGYLGESIESYFGTKYNNASIEYIREDKQLGTGGAIKLVLNKISFVSDKIIVSNGDTWFPINMNELHDAYKKNSLPITIALKLIENNSRYSGVTLINNTIEQFNIKNSGPTLINAGTYLINTKSIRNQLDNFKECFSMEHDFMNEYALSGMIGANIQNVPFLDIGIPDDYKTAALMLKERTTK